MEICRWTCFSACVVSLLILMVRDHPGTVSAMTIPTQYDGFTYPSTSLAQMPVILEAFFDPMCPDCRTAWPNLKQLVQLYGSALSLVIHPFPAPFHHNAFLSARALHVQNNLNASSTIPLLELMFEHQVRVHAKLLIDRFNKSSCEVLSRAKESFSSDATQDETPASVLQRFISLGIEAGDVSPHEIYSGFLDTTTYNAAISSFKFGCSKYVTATPTYYVNGVPTTADETWSVGRWRSVLEPLIAGKLSSFTYNAIQEEA